MIDPNLLFINTLERSINSEIKQLETCVSDTKLHGEVLWDFNLQINKELKEKLEYARIRADEVEETKEFLHKKWFEEETKTLSITSKMADAQSENEE